VVVAFASVHLVPRLLDHRRTHIIVIVQKTAIVLIVVIIVLDIHGLSLNCQWEPELTRTLDRTF